MNINRAIIIGRLTKDPELRTTPSGTSLATFSVATSRQWKDNAGQKQEKAEFHNVIAWGKQAEVIAKFFTKGQEIYVEGRLETRNWDDKETGKKMYKTEIVLERFDFGAKPANAQPQEPAYQRKEDVPTIDLDEETPEVSAEKVQPKDVKVEDGNIEADEEEIKIEDVPF